MAKVKIKNSWKRIGKTLLYILLFFMLMIIGIIIFLNTNYGKNLIAQKSIEYLNSTFGTEITTDQIEIDWKSDIILHNVIIKDHKKYDFIKAQKLIADVNIINLAQQLYLKDFAFNDLTLDKVTLENPTIRVITYKGETQDNFTQFIDKFSTKSKTESAPFTLNGEVEIKQANFSIVNENIIENPTWLDTENLNLWVTDFKLIGNAVTAKLKNFNFKGRRNNENYELKQFTSDFIYNDSLLIFNDLHLETQGSKLIGNLQLHRNPKEGFADFSNKVFWDFNLKDNSYFSGKDIRYFSSQWNNDKSLKINTKMQGTLNDFTLQNLKASAENFLLQSENLHFFHILEDDFQIQGEKSIADFSEKSLKNILPTFITAKLKNHLKPFGSMNYKGNFVINHKDVSAQGNFQSALGLLQVDAKLFNYSSQIPNYQGIAFAKNVNLSPLTHDNTLGTFSGKFNFKGKGFDLSTIDVDFQTQFSSVSVAEVNLNNLFLQGNFSKKIFNGKVSINDAFAQFTGNGIVDLSNPKKYKVDINADIKHFDVAHYKLTKDKPTAFSGIIDANIQFTSLEDLTGIISLKNAIITVPHKVVPIEKLYVKTELIEGERRLMIDAPSFVNGNLHGKFNLKNLPEMLTNGFGNLLVGYKPKTQFPSNYIAFDLMIEDDIINLLVPKLEMDRGTSVKGTYSGNNNHLNIELNAPTIFYDGTRAEQVAIQIDTSIPNKQVSAQIANVYIASQRISDLDIEAYKRNDSLFVNNKFNLGEEKTQHFNLNLYQIRQKDIVQVGFLSSNIQVNAIDWSINTNNDTNTNLITYNINTGIFNFDKIEVKNNEASITAKGFYENAKNFQFQSDINNIQLEKFIPKEMIGDITLKGKMDGKLFITQNSGVIKPDVDVTINQLDINDFLVGNLKTKIEYDVQNNLFNVNADIVKDYAKTLNISGIINNSKEEPEMNLKAAFNDFEMKVVGNFLKSVFSNFRGTATGEIDLTGKLKNPSYNGAVTMKKFGFKVNYLGVDYEFANEPYVMLTGDSGGQGSIILDNLEFFTNQNKEQTRGFVSGQILTNKFVNWGLNLQFDTDKKGLLVLDTKSSDNELFYGRIKAVGDLYISGDVSSLNISAKEVKVLRGSQFTLNSNASANVSDDFNYIKFINQTPKTSSTSITEKKKPQGLYLDFNLEVEEGALASVIIDEKTESYIKDVNCKSDNLRFTMTQSGDITMLGNLQIIGGKFNYGLSQGISREFRIENGSTLQWNDDPYNPDININATYNQTVTNVGDYLSLSYQPTIETQLQLSLTETLMSPNINYDIKTINTTSVIQDGLSAKFAYDADEKLKQFAGVLFLKQFVTNEGLGAGFTGQGYTILAKQILNFLNTISPDFQLNFEIVNSENANSNASRALVSNVTTISDKITVKTTIGFSLNNTTSNEKSVTTNVDVEYDLSKEKDKSTLLRAFSRPNTFGVQNNYAEAESNNQMYGLGIVWRKSFNTFNFNEILRKKKNDSLKIITNDTIKKK